MRGIYIVGGYPNRDDFKTSFTSVAEAGFEFIEVGLPFNDPVADGPVISNAANSTIDSGITTEEIIEDIISLKDISIQKYIMTYANIIYSYGIKKFSDRLKDCVDGIILADVPNRMVNLFYDQGFEIPIVPFATPETRLEDIEIMNNSKSEFIYFVGVRGITGSKADLQSDEIIHNIQAIKAKCDKKVILGFGIKTKADADSALSIADGFVVGTEAVKRQGSNDFKQYVSSLIS